MQDKKQSMKKQTPAKLKKNYKNKLTNFGSTNYSMKNVRFVVVEPDKSITFIIKVHPRTYDTTWTMGFPSVSPAILNSILKTQKSLKSKLSKTGGKNGSTASKIKPKIRPNISRRI